MADDLYTLLGVARDASPQDIKRAFRTLAKELHPDVTGDDPEKVERFKAIKSAYEVLSDPAERGRYDRRHERRSGPFVGSHWRHAGTPASGPSPRGNPGNDIGLDDLVNSFGHGDFGFGGARPRNTQSTQPPPPPRPQSGRDIALTVSIPADIAARGGTVTVTYHRLRRADDNRTLYRYEEIYDVRVAPGTMNGESLRIERMGDAGPDGGPFGDLVCDLRVVEAARTPPPPPPRMRMPRAHDAPPEGETVRVNVGVVEAVLGGRVEVETPTGNIRIAIPSGTSSGTRMRLRGRGTAGGDLFAEIRIVVPRNLDAESRALMERFGQLNPGPFDD